MRKVLITDHVWPDVDAERSILEPAGIQVVVAPSGDEDTLARLAADTDAIMFCFARVPAAVLQAAPRCLVAARYGIGVDNIDLSTATDLGIIVTNVPGYCTAEVAEHVLAMILALNRRLGAHDRMVKAGRWDSIQLTDHVHRLSDATLGIVGYGRIGRAVATRAKAFGMRVIVTSRSMPVGGSGSSEEAEMVTLDELLPESDFVSLHVPLTDETVGLMGEEQIARMKPGAILINAARGGLVDDAALSEALRDGRLAGAGIDVMETVPPPPDHPLFAHENVIITPHTAFFSQASTLELQTRTAREVLRVLNGHCPESLVNPEVLSRTRIRLGPEPPLVLPER